MSTDTLRKILFLDAYYMPETIAFTHLENDLIDGLIDSGYQVKIICPTPTRNVSDETYQSYRQKKKEIQRDGKLTIRRFWAPREGKNPIVRAMRYFWCNLRTYQLGKQNKDADYVFCNSTPPTQGLIAGWVAKKLKVPMIYTLQDVFPDSLVTTGLTKEKSLIWRIGRKLEDKVYSYARDIVVISDAMRNNIEMKGVSPQKVHVISNWIDTDHSKPITQDDNPLYKALGIDPSFFTVVYAGNMGNAQGAEIILESAKLLKGIRARFLLFGGGSEYEKLCRQVQNEKIDNVRIMPLLPPEQASAVYSLGDVALITCKPGVGSSGMPSKTWTIMACNVPIIAAFDKQSDLNQVLKTAHAGICVDPGDAEALASAILSFMDNGYITNGREYVMANASRHHCVNQYLSLFLK